MGNKASKKKKSKKEDKNTNDDEDEFGFEKKTNDDEFKSAPLPSSIERILAENTETVYGNDLPSIKAFGGSISDQPLTTVDDAEIPSILVMLKKYFYKYNAYKYDGIFDSDSVKNEDVNKVKTLIEKQKITLNKLEIPNYNNNEKFYALIFGELIKIWISSLDPPLLQPMPSTFFDGITEVDFLELDIDKVPEPNLSSLTLLWDICAKIVAESKQEDKGKKIAIMFAPYLYKDKDEERNAQIIVSLTKFFEIGIEWRTQ